MTKIGMQISSIEKYLQTSDDIFESFRKIREIGYNSVQIQWVSPDIPMVDVYKSLIKNKLYCVGTQDYYDEVIANLDKVIKMNDHLDGTYICVSGLPERHCSLKGCLTFACELNKLSKQLKKNGKILTFHPRAHDILHFDCKNALDIIFENTDDTLQFNLDVYHLVKAGLNPFQWIYKFQGRTDLIHFKDFNPIPDNQNMTRSVKLSKVNRQSVYMMDKLTPLGQGIIEWQPIFRACMDTGIKYCFAEQEIWEKDPFECFKESHDFLLSNGFID